MFGLRSLRPAQRARPQWICDTCRQQRSPARRQTRALATQQTSPPRPKGRRGRGLLVTGSVVLVAVGLVNFTEGGEFARGAVVRASRVLRTLTVNINDYRKILNQKDVLKEDEYEKALKECHQRCADRTLRGMEKNGSIFIKLGQHLTSLNYLLPNEWCDTFIPLQDQCPVTSFEDVKGLVEKDTGKPFDEVFLEFEEQPLGAASLAQVHRAIDKESRQRVAVKIQHPVLDYWGPLDLALTKFTFQTLARVFPDYDLTWLSSEMEVSLPQELDFAMEGENALRCKEYFRNVKDMPLVIPDVLWSKRRILAMEYVTGHRPDDHKYLDSNGIDRDQVSATMARIFNIMIFSPDAPLHCDPHGGNIAVRVNTSRSKPHNFDIILYDHGLYRTVPVDVQRNYAKLWLAVLDADEDGMRKYAWELAGITDKQFPLFASAITGRDYRVVKEGISKPKSREEKKAISDALGEDLLPELVQLLGHVPRIILLILKTNDLTRSLDSSLETRQGPIRTFLILASYAARTVYDEQLERLRSTGSYFWPPRNAVDLVTAWLSYARVEAKLSIYEWYLYLRGLVGLSNAAPAGVGAP